MKTNVEAVGGHGLWDVKRFADSTRHMILYREPLYDTPIGVSDRVVRRFVSEEEYQKARNAERRGEIRIVYHAEVIEGHIISASKKRRK